MAIRLEDDWYEWTPEIGETVRVARGDVAGLQALCIPGPGQKRLTLHVPEHASLDLILPAMPRTSSEVRLMLRDAAPVATRDLAWTCPRSIDDEGAIVALVRRAWLDPRVAEVEGALGIVPRVIVEPTGHPLIYRSPAQRRRNLVTSAVVGASAVISILALALVPPEEPTRPMPSPLALAGAMPSRTGIIQTVTALGGAAPGPEGLAALSAGSDGRRSVQFLVSDPDALRATLVTIPALRGYREMAQSREAAGGYRVTYTSTRQAQRPIATRSAPILVAASRADAVNRVRSLLLAEGVRRVIQLRLGGDAAGGSARLRMRIDAVGPQGALLEFADRIESGIPPALITDWQLQPDPLGVRLTGTVAVPWRRPA